MRRLARSLWLLATVLCAPAHAQSATPFLWAVAGGGTTHYLLGSLHMLPASAHPLPAALGRAYAAAEVVVLESDLAALSAPELQQAMLDAALAKDPAGIKSEIDIQAYARLREQTRRLGLPETVCDPFRAWFCALTLEIAGFQRAHFAPEHGIDQHYYLRASADGKALAWLESPQAHLALFTEMPPVLGPAYLAATLDSLEQPDGTPAALLHAWQHDDQAFLAARVEALRTEHPRAYARLLAERNQAWLPALQAHFRGTRPALVIVGAAHLVGPDSLPEALRRLGLTVTRATEPAR